MPYAPNDPFDNAFANSVLSITTPIFNDTELVGIYGAHFNADSFFANLIDPMLDLTQGISYWVFAANDLSVQIHTSAANKTQTLPP